MYIHHANFPIFPSKKLFFGLLPNPQTIQDIYASLPDLLLYAHLIPLCILSVKKLPSFSEESSK